MNKYTLEYIKKNGLILLEAISGSHAYGTNIETSDTDIRGVFICELDDFLCGRFPEQVSDEKNDIVFYELSTFMSLLKSNNPNILELLNIPEKCIITKSELFDEILKHKDSFITKGCKNSFGGYAVAQIKKARGLNKKQNWEKEKVTRKDILDFTYVIEGGGSIPWKKWCLDTSPSGMEYVRYENKFCGVANVPHARDIYAVYYDESGYACLSENVPEWERERNKKEYYDPPYHLGYKGIVKVGGSSNAGESNQLRLSSIPKGEKPICNIYFNKDGYSQHCKDFKEYSEWLEKRNVTRYVENKTHGQVYDGKNIMHCVRLINMVKEIGDGKGINVHRPEREELLKIRRGDVNFDELIEQVEEDIKIMDTIFENSNLPSKVDLSLVNDLLITTRKKFYKI